MVGNRGRGGEEWEEHAVDMSEGESDSKEYYLVQKSQTVVTQRIKMGSSVIFYVVSRW